MRTPARAGNRIALHAQAHRPEREHAVALRAAQGAVGEGDVDDRARSTDDARADQDVVERRSVDREVAERDLVPEDGDAVHPPRLGDGDVQPADADARRDGSSKCRVRDVEDGVCEVGLRRRRVEARRPEAERHDARAVRRDRGVVAREPEAARRIALAAGKLG
jgi:hypothetical protein